MTTNWRSLKLLPANFWFKRSIKLDSSAAPFVRSRGAILLLGFTRTLKRGAATRREQAWS